ncbi:MAG: pyridoxal phosphate-dependent aminotransferase, partial [Acidimicrobiales bacterium]
YGTFLTLCNPGDQVLIPDPGWPNFTMIASIQGLEAVRYPLRPQDRWVPKAEIIEPLITERTKLLLINSPSNPTGAALQDSDLKPLLELAATESLWVVSDEVYDEMFFDGPVAPSAATVGDPERIVSVWSFSKTYAMTGWRVGYLRAPDSLMPLILKTPEAMTACVNAPAQMAAVAALEGPQDCVARMRTSYRERRDRVSALVDEGGIRHLAPNGAFYTWIDISVTGMGSSDFVRRLLLESHVAVTPGRTFGPGSDDFVRLSLATEPSLLLDGTRRLVEAIREWSLTPQ